MKRTLVAAAFIGMLAPSPVGAQAGPLVRLDLSCPDLNAKEVRRVLQAELGAESVTWESTWVTIISLTCDGSSVRLGVRDPVSRKTLARDLSLEGVAERSRERLLALAAAELVIASWVELQVIPSPAVEPAGPAPPKAVVSAVRGAVSDELRSVSAEQRVAPKDPEPGARPKEKQDQVAQPTAVVEPKPWQPHPRRTVVPLHRVVAFGSVRGFVTYEGILGGGGLRYGKELRRIFSYSLDAMLENGIFHSGNARYKITSSTVSGQVMFSHRGRYGAARGGAGLRVGMVRTEVSEGRVTTSGTAIAPWGWPMLVGSLNLRLFGGAVLEVASEAGYVLLPTSVGSTQVGDPSLNGVWLSGQLGVGSEW